MDIKQVQSIIKDFEKSNITALEIEFEGFKLKLSKNAQVDEVVQHGSSRVIDRKDEVESVIPVISKGFEVKSPLVGTFYSSSSPKENPFVSVGQRVEKGQTLCIIEAMKIMNEITAPVGGIIEAINIKNGAPVGFDQTLMVIV